MMNKLSSNMCRSALLRDPFQRGEEGGGQIVLK
jgi:hypothetical protein